MCVLLYEKVLSLYYFHFFIFLLFQKKNELKNSIKKTKIIEKTEPDSDMTTMMTKDPFRKHTYFEYIDILEKCNPEKYKRFLPEDFAESYREYIQCGNADDLFSHKNIKRSESEETLKYFESSSDTYSFEVYYDSDLEANISEETDQSVHEMILVQRETLKQLPIYIEGEYAEIDIHPDVYNVSLYHDLKKHNVYVPKVNINMPTLPKVPFLKYNLIEKLKSEKI